MYDVNRLRKMVSFDFSKEIEKHVFRLVTSVGEIKNSECHEESNLRPPDSTL